MLIQDGSAIRLTETLPTPTTLAQAPAITIFIHGFRGVEAIVATYFQDTISLLASNDRYTGSIVVFDWPSTARDWLELSLYERKNTMQMTDGSLQTHSFTNPTYTPYGGYTPRHSEWVYYISWESAHYGIDQSAARNNGATSLAKLIDELRKLNGNTKITLIGHSMGCYVIQQALVQHPEITESVNKIIWLAPDVGYDVFDDHEFAKTTSKISSLNVFYSRNDGAQKWPSRIENGRPRLGAMGPRNAVPNNVIIHDLTKTLANVDQPLTSRPKVMWRPCLVTLRRTQCSCWPTAAPQRWCRNSWLNRNQRVACTVVRKIEQTPPAVVDFIASNQCSRRPAKSPLP